MLFRNTKTDRQRSLIWAKDTGAPEGRNLEFAYLDLVKELGLFVEIYPEHVEKHHESNIGGHDF